MKQKSKRTLLAEIALLFTTLIWGGGFVAVKDALNSITPLYMMAVRFLCASILMGLIFFKTIKKITKKDILYGSIVGVFLFTGFATQTIGLQYTTVGKQAFLTALYVVIIPFLVWAVEKKRPDIYSIFSTILALSGIGFLNITDGFKLNMNFGDWLTLICAVFFAAHIVAISHFAKKSNPIILSVTQMLFTGILSLISALIFEPKFNGISKNGFISIFYLVVFSTMIAFLIQNVAQKYAHPNHVGVILCLESVFGAILSVIILHEVFTSHMILGCMTIFIAIVISETKLNFIKPLFKSKEKVNNKNSIKCSE
jgi:drug/metabolite transporter (DMT)-like permease